MKKIGLAILLLITFNQMHGQDLEIDQNSNLWLTFHTRINLGDKWYFNNETHLRRSEFLAEWQQVILRPSITFKLDKKFSFKAGYSRLWNYPYNRTSTKIIPEDNFWQRLLITQHFAKSKLEQSYRYELRWIGNLENNEITSRRFVNRLRYRIKYDRNIGKKGIVLTAYNEIFISISNGYRQIGFNQNWTYIGIGKKLSTKLKLQFGFIRQYIRRSSTRYESNFNTRIDFTHTLN